MEEVGSHEGVDEHICAAADAGRGDAVVSDALQEAAQTNVPDSKWKTFMQCINKHGSHASRKVLETSVIPLLQGLESSGNLMSGSWEVIEFALFQIRQICITLCVRSGKELRTLSACR